MITILINLTVGCRCFYECIIKGHFTLHYIKIYLKSITINLKRSIPTINKVIPDIVKAHTSGCTLNLKVGNILVSILKICLLRLQNSSCHH